MKSYYGNQTRNSIPGNTQLEEEKILVIKDQRLGYHQSSNDSIILTETNNPLHSIPLRNSVGPFFSRKHLETTGSSKVLEYSPDQKLQRARRERSESRSRRLQNLSENEKQAFLQECQNIQNMVRASV